MNYLPSVVFFLSEGVLLYWLLFRNRRFVEEVVLRRGARDENSGEEHEQPLIADRILAGAPFRRAVTLVCALLAGAAGLSLGGIPGLSPYDTAKLLGALLGLSAAMMVDLYLYKIPNRFIIELCAFRILILLSELLGGRSDWKASTLNSLMGLTLTFVVLLLLSLITRQGIGMGDVKLLSAVGFLCGITVVLNTLVYALILCTVCSIFLLLSRKRGIRDKVPFAPFLWAGFVVSVLLGAI